MLAYVFWHWPQRDISTTAYEELQRAFQEALATSSPHGFLGSHVFRVTSPARSDSAAAPWLGAPSAYADWYLVDTSAALDALNEAAVSGICETPHAQVARS